MRSTVTSPGDRGNDHGTDALEGLAGPHESGIRVDGHALTDHRQTTDKEAGEERADNDRQTSAERKQVKEVPGRGRLR